MCKISNTTPICATQNFEKDFSQWFNTLQNDLGLDSKTQDMVDMQQLVYQDYPQFEFELEQPKYVSLENVYSPPPSDINYSPSSTNNSSPIHKPITPPKTNSESEDIPESLKRKRAKQNEAARRCRQKRLDQLKDLQDRLAVSESERFQFSVRLAVLEQEKLVSQQREDELQMRLNSLKKQLDESQMMFLGIQNQ